MLNIKDVGEELEQKIEAVRGYVRERSESSREYQQALEKLTIEPFGANNGLPRYSGARILEGGFIKPFVQQWKNHADAQNWMDRTLSNTTVGAVDGSQIYPDKTYNLPVAVIQTGSIYNKHTNAKSFKQRTNALIITPEEFEAAHVYTYSDEFVDARRFKAECEMLNYRDRQIGTLSGGQQQRVLIARALVSNPELLLLDEPTAGVDASAQREFYELLKKLNEKTTIVLVSHDLTAVSVYVDKIACLNRKLFYHNSKEIRPEDIEATYQCPIELIAHGVPHRVLKEH